MPPEVIALLAESLPAWGLEGHVEATNEGGVWVRAGDHEMVVARAPAELPFRYVVTYRGRERGVASVAGVLRTLRSIVDPGFRPVRVRIASGDGSDGA